MSACRVPANQMIYQLLLNKAACYSYEQQPYKAKAYKKAAESVATHLYDIRNGPCLIIPYVGPRIAQYIRGFIYHPCSISFCSTCQLAEVPKPPLIKREVACGGPAVPSSLPKCKVPANQPIYEALMKKRDSYPSSATQPVKELYSNAAKAKACRKAAEAVLACDWDIAQNTGSISRLCGESLEAFIIDHINSTKAAQAATAPKLLTPKEVVEALKQNALSRKAVETKGRGTFSYLADEDEREQETGSKYIPLIRTTAPITVQQLITALQEAVKKDPSVATMKVEQEIRGVLYISAISH